MKAELFTFCDFAQDNGGKLTIVGTFDTIVSRNFPFVHPQLSVVIRIRFDITEFGLHDFRIETRAIDSELSMDTVSGKIDVKGAGNASAVFHLVFGISNLQFKNPGVINFVLYIDNKEISSVPLYIRQV
ncbi:MAG: hypothetical protein LBU66_01845 [Treponema sp.]|jgi:hypothetical protein|nr:hypothetical protein [Treponema sp.]